MPKIAYRVAFPEPATHYFDVTLRVSEIGGFRGASAAGGLAPEGTLEFSLPVWTPGSYSIEDYARHLVDLRAQAGEGEGGPELPVEKVGKSTWRVQLGGHDPIRLEYRVYAHQLDVDAADLDEHHAFWNGTLLFLYLEGGKEFPCTLQVEAPEGWRVYTGLEPVEGTPGLFRAADYDELVDCPVECGTPRLYTFEVEGVPHRLVLDGHGNEEPERLVADLRAVVAEAARLMGGLPYKEYTFLVHLLERRGGGLEHRNSTAIQVGRFQFREPKEYARVLTLFAHEFFHLWNVKRIRPLALGPFDYLRENLTRLLWAMEGLTDYYAWMLVGRAGVVPRERFLEYIAETIQRLEETPGRRVQPLAGSSWDSWIHFYRPDENTPNTGVSYYVKGSLVGLALDVEIRSRTGGRRSLDDVMRLLWQRYGSRDQGIPELEGWKATAEEACGFPLDDFFARYVTGSEEIDWAGRLEFLGLELERRREPEETQEPEGQAMPGSRERWAWWYERRPGAELGVRVEAKEGRLRVTTVLEDGPAYGSELAPGDEIVAVDGFRVTDEKALRERLADRRPGERVRLTTFRREEERHVEVKLAERRPSRYTLKPVARPSDAQREAFAAWTHGQYTLSGEEKPA
ncbi:MAG: PDZ domain-containing protein [Bacillota bacterium]|nr:PDZ domain-containing protein [Bacillota bacterium]